MATVSNIQYFVARTSQPLLVGPYSVPLIRDGSFDRGAGQLPLGNDRDGLQPSEFFFTRGGTFSAPYIEERSFASIIVESSNSDNEFDISSRTEQSLLAGPYSVPLIRDGSFDRGTGQLPFGNDRDELQPSELFFNRSGAYTPYSGVYNSEQTFSSITDIPIQSYSEQDFLFLVPDVVSNENTILSMAAVIDESVFSSITVVVDTINISSIAVYANEVTISSKAVYVNEQSFLSYTAKRVHSEKTFASIILGNSHSEFSFASKTIAFNEHSFISSIYEPFYKTNLFKFLPGEMRSIDKTVALCRPENVGNPSAYGDLEAFCKIVGTTFDQAQSLVDNISDIFDPETCPESLLPELAAVIGLTLNLNDNVSAQRRQIKNHISIVKKKGLEEAYRIFAYNLGYYAEVVELYSDDYIDFSPSPGLLAEFGGQWYKTPHFKISLTAVTQNQVLTSNTIDELRSRIYSIKPADHVLDELTLALGFYEFVYFTDLESDLDDNGIPTGNGEGGGDPSLIIDSDIAIFDFYAITYCNFRGPLGSPIQIYRDGSIPDRTGTHSLSIYHLRSNPLPIDLDEYFTLRYRDGSCLLELPVNRDGSQDSINIIGGDRSTVNFYRGGYFVPLDENCMTRDASYCGTQDTFESTVNGTFEELFAYYALRDGSHGFDRSGDPEINEGFIYSRGNGFLGGFDHDLDVVFAISVDESVEFSEEINVAIGIPDLFCENLLIRDPSITPWRYRDGSAGGACNRGSMGTVYRSGVVPSNFDRQSGLYDRSGFSFSCLGLRDGSAIHGRGLQSLRAGEDCHEYDEFDVGFVNTLEDVYLFNSTLLRDGSNTYSRDGSEFINRSGSLIVGVQDSFEIQIIENLVFNFSDDFEFEETLDRSGSIPYLRGGDTQFLFDRSGNINSVQLPYDSLFYNNNGIVYDFEDEYEFEETFTRSGSVPYLRGGDAQLLFDRSGTNQPVQLPYDSVFYNQS